MRKAYERGLPRWSDIKVIYDQYNEQFDREKEGELLESILQGFSMGVPATEAVEHENEMRAQRRRRLQMQLEEE